MHIDGKRAKSQYRTIRNHYTDLHVPNMQSTKFFSKFFIVIKLFRKNFCQSDITNVVIY